MCWFKGQTMLNGRFPCINFIATSKIKVGMILIKWFYSHVDDLTKNTSPWAKTKLTQSSIALRWICSVERAAWMNERLILSCAGDSIRPEHEKDWREPVCAWECVTHADANENEANQLLERAQHEWSCILNIDKAFCRLPDVCRGQRLQLSGEEELSVSQLMLVFLWEIQPFQCSPSPLQYLLKVKGKR